MKNLDTDFHTEKEIETIRQHHSVTIGRSIDLPAGYLKLVLFLLLSIVFFGCSHKSYKEYAEAHHQSTKEKAQSRAMIFTTAFQAVNEICKVFDQAVATQSTREKTPIMTREGTDLDGNPVTDTVYLAPQDPGISILLAGVAKSMILREIYPIIKEITHEMTNKLERPVTVEEVMLKVADEAGLIAVIGGMYGLGREGIKHAGAALNNVSSDNGAAIGVSNAGAAVGANSPLTDNHVIND